MCEKSASSTASVVSTGLAARRRARVVSVVMFPPRRGERGERIVLRHGRETPPGDRHHLARDPVRVAAAAPGGVGGHGAEVGEDAAKPRFVVGLCHGPYCPDGGRALHLAGPQDAEATCI